MPPAQVALALVALVVAACVLGLVIRSRNGRARQIDQQGAAPSEHLRDADLALGERATLVQFSTPVCSVCGPTRIALRTLAGSTDGVRHVDIDLVEHPEFADRFSILQTPTTLVLDRAGAVRARIGGAPRPGVVQAELARVLS